MSIDNNRVGTLGSTLVLWLHNLGFDIGSPSTSVYLPRRHLSLRTNRLCFSALFLCILYISTNDFAEPSVLGVSHVSFSRGLDFLTLTC